MRGKVIVMKKHINAAVCLLLALCLALTALPAAFAANNCDGQRAGAFAGQAACVTAEGALHLCANNIPDGAFRAYLASFDRDGDGALSETEAAGATFLGCAGRGIADLTGVGFFADLTTLDCSDNLLKALDLSANRKLTALKCGGNALSVLDLTANTALTTYTLSPQIVEYNYDPAKQNIDVSKMLGKWTSDCIIAFGAFFADGREETMNEQGGRAAFPQGALYAEYTVNANHPDEKKVIPMTVRVYPCIDGSFAGKPARTVAGRLMICEKNFPDAALRGFLRTLAARDGHTLTETELLAETLSFPRRGVADLTGLAFFIALKTLDCSGNRLEQLPAGLLKGLTSLNCANNRLTALDLSGCASLRTLDCSGNRLAALDLSACKALDPAAVTLGGQALEDLRYIDRNGSYDMDLSQTVGADHLHSVTAVRAATSAGGDAGARYDSKTGTVTFTAPPASLTYSYFTSPAAGEIPYMEVTAPLARGEADCVKGTFNGRDGYVRDGRLHLCDKNFPDEAFLNKIKPFDADGDGLLSAAEAEKITSLTLADSAAASLRGVEFLPALKQLSATNCRLTELDVSANRELTALNCAGNRLTSLDLSANINLLPGGVTAGRQTGKPLTVAASDGKYAVDLTACVGEAALTRVISVFDRNLAPAAYDAKTGKAVFPAAPESPVTYTFDVGLKSGAVTMNVVCETSSSPAQPTPGDHKHNPVYVAAKAACEADGLAAHYECSCGKWFSDEKGEREVAKDALTVSGPIGHKPAAEYSVSPLYHWFACVREGCGLMMPGTFAPHRDADGNGACDVCGSTAMSKGVLGDVDADGALTPADARLALRCSVGLEKAMTPASAAYVTADANNDGTVEPEDARLILRASINLVRLTDYVK